MVEAYDEPAKILSQSYLIKKRNFSEDRSSKLEHFHTKGNVKAELILDLSISVKMLSYSNHFLVRLKLYFIVLKRGIVISAHVFTTCLFKCSIFALFVSGMNLIISTTTCSL